MEMWKELGFDKDVEIKYSTPTLFYNGLAQQNEQFAIAKNISANDTSEEGQNKTDKEGWAIRRDDTFPYQPTK